MKFLSENHLQPEDTPSHRSLRSRHSSRSTRCPQRPGDGRSALVTPNKIAEYCSSHNHFLRLFHTIALFTCLILLPATTIIRSDAQQQTGGSFLLQSPVFTKSMDSHTIKENAPLNEVIYTLEAQLETSDQQRQQQIKILYGIEGTQLFSVDKATGQVRVAQPIDREQTSDSITLQVSATPHLANRPAGPPARLTITVFILDENDNAPRIERVRIGRLDYSSNQLLKLAGGSYPFATSQQQIRPTPVIRLNVSENTPVDSNIVDLIEATDVDKASSNPLSATCLDCDLEFELKSTTANLLNDRLDWSIVLVRPLVHLPRQNVRQLHVIVTDGKFNSSIVFEVTIDDVQNRPPQFVGSTTCVVKENVPIDSVIMTLQAVDGDALALDDTPQQLLLGGGRFKGRQVVFDFINSNNQSTSLLDDFKLNPLTGQLQVANRLDREAYLNVNGVLTFQVRARELTVDAETVVQGDDNPYETIPNKLASIIDQSPYASTTIDITIILTDVNDNAPHWLNSSEILALNLNQSPVWHQNLPLNDRDTGRNYQIQVPENLAPGSAITMKNGMFVYDLDNGENSQFVISLVDPFNLFDVEPKRINGFGMVTLKLASNSKRAKLLDYENINERSYIIQLLATETGTKEHYESKAQVQIKVLDVNDNAPEFKEPTYVVNIREDAPPGKLIRLIQATDKDEVSKQIRYSLHGRSAYLFDINPLTGLVTVAKCETSSSAPNRPPSGGSRLSMNALESQWRPTRPCLDYEQQPVHHLMVEASDGELSSKVPLTVYVDDASDNAPVFSLPIVDVVIEEGSERLDPPIKIEATDADRTSVPSYSIVEGNFEGLFSINNLTGELQLTRPIRIAHDDLSGSSSHLGATPLSDGAPNLYRQQQLNKMTLIVQATDGQYKANGTVRIDILDANDNAPKFSRDLYRKEINESFVPGQEVLHIRAFDYDRGNNARVSYRIERGSHNQFEINETTGEIVVAPNATPFDASKRENYTLEVVAYDHGAVSKSSSVLVHLKVLSSSQRAPQFQPQIQRTTIHENTLNNTIIHRMAVAQQSQLSSASSPDQQLVQSMLIFEPGPIEGLDKYGHLVTDTERLESIFSVSTDTGDVAVNSNLDHDFVSFVNLTVYVTSKQVYAAESNYAGAISELPNSPRSTGYLLITIVDENNNPPVFGAPWSPSQPDLTFQMQEELPVGSTLAQLVASDADSKISHYKIDPPNDYFELASPQSGVIVNKKLIDYDSLMRQTFLTPSSSRSHQQQQQQQHLQQPQQAPTNNIIQFNVFAFDSGQPQLAAKAIVSVEILPVNDWDCKFEQPLYEVRVKENPQPDTVITQVRASDLDFGEQHNAISYALLGDSEYRDFFNVDSRTGVVTISNRGSLELDRERLKQSTIILTVVGRNNEQKVAHHEQQPQTKSSAQQQSARTCSATVKIHVDDVNDNPPLFSQKLYEVSAYDTDTIEVPLVKLMIRDEDSLNNLATSSPKTASGGGNTFRILAGNLNDSFNITSSGLIYATKPLNETFALLRNNNADGQQQPIQLRVQVKQQTFAGSGQNLGVPTMSTDECLVRIHLAKINRVAPEWRLDSIKSVAVEENKRPGTLVTQLKCTDRDLDSAKSWTGGEQDQASKQHPAASPIRYWIKENGANVLETNEFKLDSVTGNLVTRVELDREAQELYQMVVSCEDNGKLQSLESIVPLYISVLDVDDNKPEFVVPKSQQLASTSNSRSSNKLTARPTIKFSIEEHQSKGMPIGELKAVDRDLEAQYPTTYCIIEGNEFQDFSLDRITGILYTNATLDREKQSAYELLVIALNDGTTCEDHSAKRSKSGNSTTLPASTVANGLVGGIDHPFGNDQRREGEKESSLVAVQIDVLDINDNAPIFKRPIYRAGVHHRSLMNTLITQVSAFDPDSSLNGSSNYKISEILMYKTNTPLPYHSTARKYDSANQQEQSTLSKPIKLIQFPFRIDQQGNIYTQQLLTQYQLMSMFVLQIEATEQAEPWRTASTKLEIYLYESNSQLKIKINLHPRLVEAYRYEIESMLSNSTKFTAIINRAKSYHGNNQDSSLQSGPSSSSSSQQRVPTIDLSSARINQYNNPVPSLSSENEPNFSNILAVFVDNNKIVNPNIVMEKFDLTSAQLFTPQMLLMQRASSSSLLAANNNQQQTLSQEESQLISQEYMRAGGNQQQSGEFASLIDKIALASVQANDHYNSSPSLLVGIDWLESPSVLFVCLTSLLVFIGLIICITGCCCTSRIKDHIIKAAMDKLVKQQTLQAKINERVLAATNQAYANSTINGGANNNQDYILQQGGLMCSFDATKGCMNNNYENMSILQRAMEAGEFIDSNYTTLNNVGHMNLGAHYYDASELDHEQNMAHEHHLQQQQVQEQEHQIDMGDACDQHGGKHHQFNGSTNSLSLNDEITDEMTTTTGDLNNGQHEQPLMSKAKLYSNGLNGVVSSNGQQQQRRRQQVPNGNNNIHQQDI